MRSPFASIFKRVARWGQTSCTGRESDASSVEYWDKFWEERVETASCIPFPYLPGPLDWNRYINRGDDLVQVMAEHGLKTVLCAGNGVSQEPRALAAAGLHVTALDISPVATQVAEACPVDEESLALYCSPELHRPGGRVEFVVGDLLDPEVCPGPFDAIVERLTLQRFAEPERSSALEALSSRLATAGIFLSHCLDDGFDPDLGWSQHESGMFHVSESWFRTHEWTIWDVSPRSTLEGRVAWLVRCGSMKRRPGERS